MKKSGARGGSLWIVLVVIAVMAVSAFYVGKLRLSEIPDRAIGHSPPAPQAGVVRDKSIEYVVTGPAGSSAAVSVLVIRDTIDLVDLGGWFAQANDDLDDELERSALSAQGPRGGLWSTELFLDERGDCAVFWPVSPTAAATGGGRVRREVLPSVHMAVATHHGDDATIGDVYADLGAYVSEHGIGATGPVRETYVDGIPGQSGTTEIAWPVHS
ncbi:hypothetical protein CYJ73_14085 [Gordonia terrae]|uniref:GyrI-like small molecule binding domain-containing protein n=1 Tax=Gordonia terrae TaxID=2055 RepID=A0A2I1R6Q2_9ACTN|nr:GyrI-like domain-containing protein [Gordonia terrae]PKZ64824.1 hypothetical protein CYJ73_14085 [Gordonia terrae]